MARKKKVWTRKTEVGGITYNRKHKIDRCGKDIMKSALPSDPELQSVLHLCQSSIRIKISNDKCGYKLGHVTLTLCNNIDMCLKTDVLNVYFGQKTSNCILYWEEKSFDGPVQVCSHLAICEASYEVLKGLSNEKYFQLVLRSTLSCLGMIHFDVYLNTDVLFHLNYAAEPVRGGVRTGIKTVMKFFFGINVKDYTEPVLSEQKHVEKIYENLQNCYSQNKSNPSIEHSYLIPKLRAYQSQAVHWMLQCELSPEDDKIDACLHALYVELKMPDGHNIYYNKYGGFFVSKEFGPQASCKGGVLADEMGLGKTVEVLACILLNPRNEQQVNSNHYFATCPSVPDNDDCNYNKDLTFGTGEVFNEETRESNARAKNKRPWNYDASLYTVKKHKEDNGPKLSLIKSSHENAFSQPRFECVCGSSYHTMDENTVFCEKCGLLQHANCVLNNPDDACDFYLCPYCWVSMEPVVSRATLIVSPASIIYQWKDEINKHISENSLKLFLYHGVQHHKFLQPSILADNDIVLTTYETFRKEINYVDVPHNDVESRRNLRHPKKFMAIPSPLTSIQWWRVCLDEAQMVESVTSKTSEMALRLVSVNRWCVTGTPIQKSVEDLYGLLLFLDHDPYSVKVWWKELLLKPFMNNVPENLFDVINHILWRTSKKNVLNQIGIPSQENIVHWLKFSAVEKVFYEQQHHQCSNEFMQKIGKYNCLHAKLRSMDRWVVSKVMLPLRKLRQACCHPQIVRGEFAVAKSALTMPQLLATLTKKARNECEETHRQLVASLCGLAGIYIIQKDYSKAVEMYEHVLKSAEDHAVHFRTDKLQRLHVLYNFAELLRSRKHDEAKNNELSFERDKDIGETHGPEGVQLLALKEQSIDQKINSLKERASDLRETYLKKHVLLVKSSQESLVQVTTQIKLIQDSFICTKNFPWWLQIISNCVCDSEEVNFINRIKDELLATDVEGQMSVSHRIHNIAGLQYVVATLLDELETARGAIVTDVRKLSIDPTASDVNSAADCHLRPCKTNTKRVKCLYCKVDEKFNSYESKLFRFTENALTNETSDKKDGIPYGPLRRGNWADSELEKILKFLLAYGRSHKVSDDCVQDGSIHIKMLENLKKEFKCLRSLWMQISDYVSAIDELEMATIRMRLLIPGESLQNPPVSYIISPVQVDSTLLKFHSDMICCQHELKKKLGHLFYLENLAKVDGEPVNSFNSHPCPVCQQKFGCIWSVLQCGHSVCQTCIRVLMTNYAVGIHKSSVRCPICRELTTHSEISFVDTRPNEMDSSEIPVKGSCSTKVGGVVKCLLQIHKNDNKAKSLVFSSWSNFLLLLEQALKENEIPYLTLSKKTDFHNKLLNFKCDPCLNVLLLPFTAGANGLNIIEATNVLLVEPLLDYSKAQQAIGRVHRIGQERQTTVHQFVIKGTIEEKIYELQNPFLSQMKEVEAESSMTVNDLKMLFELSSS